MAGAGRFTIALLALAGGLLPAPGRGARAELPQGGNLLGQRGLLRITANNPEQEEAEELLDVEFSAEPLEIGFNVSYVLDVLNTLKCNQIRMSLGDANSSALLEDHENGTALYVVMPMRL